MEQCTFGLLGKLLPRFFFCDLRSTFFFFYFAAMYEMLDA